MSVAAEVYRRLHAALGPQHWWPAESPFEVMVGAVLVQNTAWKNVERAIAHLRDADALDPHRLAALSPAELEELIRPAGYFRVKAKRLRNLLAWFIEQYHGSIDALQSADAGTLREELLSLNGIGPETADSILLYALHKPVLVVDAYAKRIWLRHEWIDEQADYHQLQETIADQLPADAAIFNELHAQLVHVGHHWCKPTPKCEECPLRDMLPRQGLSIDSR